MTSDKQPDSIFEQHLKGWPIVLVLLFAFASSFACYRFTLAITVCLAYGWDAYHSQGLRLIDTNGRLSNGEMLPASYRAIEDILQGVIWFGAILIFTVVIVRLRIYLAGRRLAK